MPEVMAPEKWGELALDPDSIRFVARSLCVLPDLLDDTVAEAQLVMLEKEARGVRMRSSRRLAIRSCIVDVMRKRDRESKGIDALVANQSSDGQEEHREQLAEWFSLTEAEQARRRRASWALLATSDPDHTKSGRSFRRSG